MSSADRRRVAITSRKHHRNIRCPPIRSPILHLPSSIGPFRTSRYETGPRYRPIWNHIAALIGRVSVGGTNTRISHEPQRPGARFQRQELQLSRRVLLLPPFGDAALVRP